MDDDDGFFHIDDAALDEHEAQREQRNRERKERIMKGVDARVEGGGGGGEGAEGGADESLLLGGLTAEQVEALSLQDREARWEFTKAELDAATKVVSRLFKNPGLFVGDPVLADSRLYTMISRDRSVKRENKSLLKKVMNEERARKHKEKKLEDSKAIAKTKMKQERDQALNALLLPPPPDSDDDCGEEKSSSSPKLLTDKNTAATLATGGILAKDHSVDPKTTASALAVATGDEQPTTPIKLNRIIRCHICHTKFDELHHYYYSLCSPCAELNFRKRNQSDDLHGKVVILTGCRIKIGYAMFLMLLRCGATVIGTTRFVHDCLNRLSQEADYDDWKDRVHLFALDLRDMWVVTEFCAFLQRKFPKIYAIINNAAQTIARTPEYTASLRHFEANPVPKIHERLMQNEQTTEWMGFFLSNSSVMVGKPLELEHNPSKVNSGKHHHHQDPTHTAAEATATTSEPTAAASSAKPEDETNDDDDLDAKLQEERTQLRQSFPKPRYDRYDLTFESTDQRKENSWTLNMGDVPTGEAAEVMAINALSPFILNSKLKPALMRRDGDETVENSPRFIINVSAMEGQFYRFKQTTHPHTNMAKAALNMMTRTSAADYAKDGIYMNAVDTGWITDESPVTKKERREKEENPMCPLDEVDAAARCLDPIFTRSTEHGKFFKDYKETPW